MPTGWADIRDPGSRLSCRQRLEEEDEGIGHLGYGTEVHGLGAMGLKWADGEPLVRECSHAETGMVLGQCKGWLWLEVWGCRWGSGGKAQASRYEGGGMKESVKLVGR